MLLVDSSGFRQGTGLAFGPTSWRARCGISPPALTNNLKLHGNCTCSVGQGSLSAVQGRVSCAAVGCASACCSPKPTRPGDRERSRNISSRSSYSGGEHVGAQDVEQHQHRQVLKEWQRLRQESAALQQQYQVNRQGLDDLRQLTKQLSGLVVKPSVSTIPLNSSKRRGRGAEVEALEPRLRKQPSRQASQDENLNEMSLEGLTKLLKVERARHAEYLQQLEENAGEIERLTALYRELSSQLHAPS